MREEEETAAADNNKSKNKLHILTGQQNKIQNKKQKDKNPNKKKLQVCKHSNAMIKTPSITELN